MGVAGYLTAATGIEAVDIDSVDDETLTSMDALICGALTWHTGADEQRSGTAWDEFLYDRLPSLDLSGKKVAIFGLGDQGSYGDNFCDAAGELYDCFSAQGAHGRHDVAGRLRLLGLQGAPRRPVLRPPLRRGQRVRQERGPRQRLGRAAQGRGRRLLRRSPRTPPAAARSARALSLTTPICL